jgi:LysR family transcriptional regulator, benzoate and cis,cis-muconate-responsive activator of ben and cat genes
MELRHLRYFTAVVEEQHIGRAAARLNISQPPLSRQIKQLEGELGLLLTRTPKGVEPTQAGRLLFEEARNILTLVERAAQRTKLAAQGRLGRLDVGVLGSLVLALPASLQAFRKRHPTVELALHTLNKTAQIHALRERRISIGFNLLGVRQPDLESRVVRREPLMVAINGEDPLASKTIVAVRDIAARPLLLYTSGSRPNLTDIVFDLFHREGVEPHVAQELEDSLIPAVALVAAGVGICLVPRWASRLNLPGVVFRELHPRHRLTVELHAIFRRDDSSPTLQAFLETMDRRSVRSPKNKT